MGLLLLVVAAACLAFAAIGWAVMAWESYDEARDARRRNRR